MAQKNVGKQVYAMDTFIHQHLLCRFQGVKREELIGITYNRLIRMDASNGDAIKTWRFSNMKQWNVNWEIKMVGNCLFFSRVWFRASIRLMVLSVLGSIIVTWSPTQYWLKFSLKL